MSEKEQGILEANQGILPCLAKTLATNFSRLPFTLRLESEHEAQLERSVNGPKNFRRSKTPHFAGIFAKRRKFKISDWLAGAPRFGPGDGGIKIRLVTIETQ